MIRIQEYISNQGRNYLSDWFSGLNPRSAAKVNTYLTRVLQGNFSNLKPVKGALYEVVIDWGPGYRVYLGKDGDELIILLVGGTKKRQQKDIDLALHLWKEYKKRRG